MANKSATNLLRRFERRREWSGLGSRDIDEGRRLSERGNERMNLVELVLGSAAGSFDFAQNDRTSLRSQ